MMVPCWTPHAGGGAWPARAPSARRQQIWVGSGGYFLGGGAKHLSLQRVKTVKPCTGCFRKNAKPCTRRFRKSAESCMVEFPMFDVRSGRPPLERHSLPSEDAMDHATKSGCPVGSDNASRKNNVHKPIELGHICLRDVAHDIVMNHCTTLHGCADSQGRWAPQSRGKAGGLPTEPRSCMLLRLLLWLL